MRQSFLESIGIYLPSAVVPTADVLARCRKLPRLARRPRRIERVTGILNRRFAADDEGAIELAQAAMTKCLAMSRYDPSEIDALIFCGISRSTRPPRYLLEPSIALVLAQRLELNGAVAFDVSNGCAGMFTGIQVVDSLIRAGLIRVGMVVSGERITDLTKSAQHEITGYADPRFACLTVGDAGAAVILAEAAEPGVGFYEIDLYTAGRYSDYCVAGPTYAPYGGPIMSTRSAEMFAISTQLCVPDAWRALQRIGWADGPDQFIMHQITRTAIELARHGVNGLAGRDVLHDRNVVNNLAERGNTASTSHFVALWDGIVNGRIASGDRVLFSVQGSGLTAGTALYTLDNLPDRVRAIETTTAPRATGGTATTGRRRAASRPRIRIRSLATVPRTMTSDTSYDLARMAVERCVSRTPYEKGQVDLVIHTGINRNEFMLEPATAAVVAGGADINAEGAYPSGRKTLAFDIWNGSVGFLNGCYVAASMIGTARFNVAVVVASEIDNNAGIAGAKPLGVIEGGSAVLLDASPDATTGFSDFRFDQFPEYAGAILSEVLVIQAPWVRFERHPDLEALYLKCIPRTVHALLEEVRLELDQIAVILGPQLSPEFTAALAGTLAIERDRFVDIATGEGDLFSSTLPHTFARARDDRPPRAGDIGLIVNVGSGLQVGAAIYHF